VLCEHLQQQLDCFAVPELVSTMQRSASQMIHFVHLLQHQDWPQRINTLARARTSTPPKIIGGKVSVRPAEAALQTMERYTQPM